MANVTYDWAPALQGLQGLMMHYAQKRQYEDLLKTLGTGMGGGVAGPFGGPSSAPPLPTQTARREDDNGMPIPGLPAPIQQAQGGGIPPGVGQGINPAQPGFADVLRKLPPQIGMPLLLQTMQQQMGGGAPHKLEQYDPEKDVVDPYTGQIVRKGTPKAAAASKLEQYDPEKDIVDPTTGNIVRKGTPKPTARKYEVVNGVGGWIDENGFTPDPNAPKRAVGEGDANKPPAGYRWTKDGNLEPIKGGPSDPNRPGIGVGRRTEDQAKNTQLYTRAKEQLPIALDSFDALASKWNQIPRAMMGMLTMGYGDQSLVTGEQYQRASNALNDIAASYLYSVSGATATPSEIAGTVERVMPKLGDTSQTIADKKKRLQDMVESIKYRAGGESSNAAQPSSDTPEGVDPQVWQYMTPQERALWQN